MRGRQTETERDREGERERLRDRERQRQREQHKVSNHGNNKARQNRVVTQTRLRVASGHCYGRGEGLAVKR